MSDTAIQNLDGIAVIFDAQCHQQWKEVFLCGMRTFCMRSFAAIVDQ